jgi:hypothetical protein
VNESLKTRVGLPANELLTDTVALVLEVLPAELGS